MKDPQALRRWRFSVTDWDDNVTWLDANGGPNGDEQAAEFQGTNAEAMDEGDRRANLWEARTGNLAANITRNSYGVVTPTGAAAEGRLVNEIAKGGV